MTGQFYRAAALTLLLFFTAALAEGGRHNVEPGSKGNTITLEVINMLPGPLADLVVAVSTSPAWVKITSRQVVSALDANTTGEAVIGFDVLSTAQSKHQGDITITISSGETPLAQKTISLVVAPPKTYKLSQNYPNPFNPTTTIEYQLPLGGRVTLKVYDLLGREVATLVNEEQTADYYRVEFHAANIASGAYFYVLQAGEFTEMRRLVLLR